MKIFTIILFLIAMLMASCKPSKRYSSCSDMTQSLKDDHFSDLVKDWGEPTQKDYYAPNNEWTVSWSGVGYNDKDAVIHFDNLDLSQGDYSGNAPYTVKAVECN